MYTGCEQNRGGLITVIPMVTETDLIVKNSSTFDCGFNTHIQQYGQIL